MLIDDILTDRGDSFYHISNADGKVWLMPEKNMRVAMNLYQPSGIKGKLLKAFFPLMHPVGFVQEVVNVEKKKCALRSELYDLLCKLFCNSDLEFSVFCGTPCVHRKITIQLSVGKKILGYCKVSDSEEIASLFIRESKVLEQLKNQGIKGIPQCLYCGKIDEDIYIFVQDTVKTQKSQVLHKWGAIHDNFLKEMEARTKRIVDFEKSDYYRTLLDLQNHTEWLPRTIDKLLIENTLNTILEKYSRKQIAFCAYHADFTPWNMFVEKNELFVFDWEYARMLYPPMLDKYHYFTQTAIFEKHWDAKEIIKHISSLEAQWVDKESYILYLLDIISRFTIREKGNIDENMEKSFIIWFEILEYIQK